ncbi:MAG: hypothetical protein F4W95_12580 [Chloroflexi bacterium]|nr:hypothetical protein [Chloroflexota bacterium]MYD49303.1 hypothetical protein [Chloroflexota bacterium]
MSDYTTGPNTFEQLCWSAHAFRGRDDDALSMTVITPQFGAALLEGKPDADWSSLVRYTNQWNTRISPDKAPSIAHAIATAAPYLTPLAASALEFDDLRCSTLDVIERAFDCLTAAHGVGPTAASAILTALNPQLFVSWSDGIRNAYFPDDKPNGATYSQFLTVMRMATLSIVSDARGQHGIDDPAGQLSTELGIDPPFSLAKFIDEYNWLTLERGMAQQPEVAAAV